MITRKFLGEMSTEDWERMKESMAKYPENYRNARGF